MDSGHASRKVGLARALSKLGYCSRAEAIDFILAGRVRLNGAVRKNWEAPVHLERDRIEVDGKAVTEVERSYWMLNKPRGAITTTADEKGRGTVYQYLPSTSPWLAPVGRLDKASEGLLLFTNDSEWAARILAPQTHLEKTYHVQIDVVAGEELAQSLMKGVTSDGELLRAHGARVLRGGTRNTWVEIVLTEGRNRHIRRMLQQLHIDVLRLIRVGIGPLALGKLPKGKSRALTLEEKGALDHAMLWKLDTPPPSRRQECEDACQNN